MEFLHLVTKFNGKAIRLPVVLTPSSTEIIDIPKDHQLILDTGADDTALTKEFLLRSDYTKYKNLGKKKVTATGDVELPTCEINGLTIANQFRIGKMNVDVLENWKAHSVVGVIGMDILSRLTFILSHEHKKFLLSAQTLPELAGLFV